VPQCDIIRFFIEMVGPELAHEARRAAFEVKEHRRKNFLSIKHA
jgi:hypothetical protein